MGQKSEDDERPRETVLIVDDDDAVRKALYWTLKSDYRVLESASSKDAVNHLQHHNIDVVVSDLHLPPHTDDITEGLMIIEAARATHPPTQVVVITATRERSAAREAVKRGAYASFGVRKRAPA